MQHFSELTFFNCYNVLVGVEGEKIIFAHHFKNDSDKEDIIRAEKVFFPGLCYDDSALEPFVIDLTDYGEGKKVDPAKVKVKFSRGTDFEQAVWKTLRTVKRGTVVTYKQLAEKSGYSGAQQAVGQAMSKNYLLLFVPCHRVVASNGKLGGFSAGIDLKKALLDLENVHYGRKGKTS